MPVSMDEMQKEKNYIEYKDEMAKIKSKEMSLLVLSELKKRGQELKESWARIKHRLKE